MASFTDIVPQFKPYIQQLPVEAMVAVGTEKQRRYEEGVQKIQAQIDSVAGMDVMRSVDKNYLQSKLNELGNNLKMVAAGDFSNFQLVNSIGGMTNQIAKDKYVQAAVQSTAWHRKQQALMDDEKKKGTLTPDNQYNYTKQLSNYLNNNNLSGEGGNPITFNGSYIPNFDVFKFAKETFDAIKPDGFSFDQVYVTDANGKPVLDRNGNPTYSPILVRMEKEGIFPAKVKETLDQIFADPRVGQQLQITGEYNYRAYDGDALFSKIKQQRTESLATIDQSILDLNLKKNGGKDVSGQIDDLMKKRQMMVDNYQSYANMAYSNPDAVRGMLYKDDVNSRYTTMFGWTKTKETQNDNPGWKANFDLEKEARRREEWQKTFDFNAKVHEDNLLMEQIKLGKKSGASGSGIGDTSGFTQGDQPSAIDMVGKVMQDYDKAASVFTSASDAFIWENVYSGQPEYENQLRALINAGNRKEEAISKILNMHAQQTGVTPEEYRATWGERAAVQYNKLTPEQKKSRNLSTEVYTNYKNARRDFDGMKSLMNSYTKDIADLGVTEGETITYQGKQVTLSPQDLIDLAVYYEGDRSTVFGGTSDVSESRSKAAYQRLVERGMGDIADILKTRLTTSTGEAALHPLSALLRSPKGTWQDIKGIFLGGVPLGETKVLDRVLNVVGKLRDKDYINQLESRNSAIKNQYGIAPNLKAPLLTGDGETDKNILYSVRSLAGAYSAVGNLSPDFKKFSENLPTSEKLDEKAFGVQSIIGADGEPRVEIVLYDNDGNRQAGMTISNEEAMKQFGINVNSLYEPTSISILKNKIIHNGNKSCDGEIKNIDTYESGDYIYDNDDFPGMQGSKYDVKVNFQFYNGKYFPFVYVSDGVNKPIVKDLPGVESLQGAVATLQKYMTPTYTQLLLNSAK